MPLASSRTASEKRAAVVKAEKEQKERRERISLPRTARSSTRVTRDSVKRRRNSRAMSEERMKKQVKAADDNDADSVAKENNPSHGSPPPRRKQSQPPLPILSPTPYWKVRVVVSFATSIIVLVVDTTIWLTNCCSCHNCPNPIHIIGFPRTKREQEVLSSFDAIHQKEKASHGR